MSVVHENDYIDMDSDVHNHMWNGDSVNLTPLDDGYFFTGIDPIGIAQDGQEIVVCNESGDFSFTISHNDLNSDDGNRFFFPDGMDHILDPYTQVWGIRREDVEGRVGWWLQF